MNFHLTHKQRNLHVTTIGGLEPSSSQETEAGSGSCFLISLPDLHSNHCSVYTLPSSDCLRIIWTVHTVDGQLEHKPHKPHIPLGGYTPFCTFIALSHKWENEWPKTGCLNVPEIPERHDIHISDFTLFLFFNLYIFDAGKKKPFNLWTRLNHIEDTEQEMRKSGLQIEQRPFCTLFPSCISWWDLWFIVLVV